MTDPGDRRGRTPPRRHALALATVPLLALLLAELVLAGRQTTGTTAEPRPTPLASAPTVDAQAARAATERATAIRGLLRQRGHAVLHHNLAEWMSVLDPQQRAFRREQRRTFRNLADVPFGSWTYTFSAHKERPATLHTMRYGVPSWSPQSFALHYRLRGFDDRSTSLQQFPTFVQRDGAWFLASLDDFRQQGHTSARALWDFGPVSVVSTDDVLVLGHPESQALMQTLAAETQAAIPRVTAVWGQGWSRRVVVLVPGTQHELARVVGDYGKLDKIAAVTTAEVRVGPGRPDPVGDRVGINPANWPKLSYLGRRIVLTHELTHVATRRVTGRSMPKWLAEGFADYVGYLGSGVPTSFVAQELRRDVLAGRVPQSLPDDADFSGSNGKLSQAYEGAWLACRLIAQRFGQRTLVRFYAAVGRSDARAPVAVAAAMQHVLHLARRPFVAQWRDYLRSELA